MQQSGLMLVAAAALLSGIPAIACDKRGLLPQHVHTHGHGLLGIAVKGKRVSMEHVAPSADIVGFEHKARTPEQKAAVAKATLADARSIFQLSAGAECKVAHAKVASWVDDEHGPDEAYDHSDFLCCLYARLRGT